MTPDQFRAWEARLGLPTAQATARALGVGRVHVQNMRDGRKTPTRQTRLHMRALERLHQLGEPIPTD